MKPNNDGLIFKKATLLRIGLIFLPESAALFAVNGLIFFISVDDF